MTELWLLLAGPATGLLGSLIGAGVQLLEHRQRLAELDAQHRHELELQRLNVAARGQELEQEALIAQSAAHAQAMAASYRHDASAGPVYRWVASALRLVRPLLTVGLIGLVGGMYFVGLPDDVTLDGRSIREHITLTVLYMAEVAVTWWFADRARDRGRRQ